MSAGRAGEEGYALVAVVASILVFAAISLSVMETGRQTFVGARADIDGARLSAAVDAGLAIAVADLLQPNLTRRVSLDGRPRSVRFGDATLRIAIQDEQGKIPLNALDEDQARRLFSLLGVTGERLDILTDSFLDWTDDDDDARPDGAETDFYAPLHIHPRNGTLRSVEEVGLIRGADDRLVAQLKDIATVSFGKGGRFRADRASLLAIQVIEGEEEGAVDIIERRRALAGQTTAIALGADESVIGNPLTVTVDASLPGGALRRSRSLVELTGRPEQPFIVRERN